MPSLKPKQKSKKTELTLSGSGIAIDYAELTKSAAKKVIANGISEERFRELVLVEGPRESGSTDVTLSVNGEAVANFDISEHPTGSKKPFKLGKKGKYYLVREGGEKGEWGKLSIGEAFDRSKLNVDVSSYDLNGHVFAHFVDLSYDGKDLEFGGTWSEGGSCFMLSPDGEKLDINFTDDDNV